MVKSGTSNLSPRQGAKPAFRQWKIKENHNIKDKLAQKLCGEKVCHVNITKSIIFQFFVVAILLRSYCFTSPFVPNIAGKSLVPDLTTRDSDHCWWSLSLHIIMAYLIDPGRFEWNFRKIILKVILVIDSWDIVVKLPSSYCHWTPLMMSQHWFRWWLGTIRQQAITSAIADSALFHHIVSLGHNEWTYILLG